MILLRNKNYQKEFSDCLGEYVLNPVSNFEVQVKETRRGEAMLPSQIVHARPSLYSEFEL